MVATIKSNLPDGTRFALLETAVEEMAADVCAVDVKVDSLASKVNLIDEKLDLALKDNATRQSVADVVEKLDGKANESDFREMRALLLRILIAVAAFAVVTLIGIVMYRIGINSAL